MRYKNDRTKSLRKYNNLTQEELAEKAFVDQRTISSIENGRSLSYQALQSIIVAFEMDITEFFQFSEPIEKTSTEIINDITAILSQLSDKDLKLCYKIITAIRDES